MSRHSYWRDYDLEELQKILEMSNSRKDFMIRLGYNRYKRETLKAIQEAYPELDFSRFTGGVFQDLTGKQFGRLKVLYRDLEKKEVFWVCQCECGNIKSIRADALKRKYQPIQSCGCLLEEARYNKLNDLTGQKFGHLTVIGRNTDHPDKKRVRYWCECDCEAHTRISVLADNLKRGHTTSCGCINSKGEDRVNVALTELGVSYEKEYSFPDLISAEGNPLRFDFMIFNKEKMPIIAIEYQGIQHYQPIEIFGGKIMLEKQQERDDLKRQYCKDKGILLLEIPYTEYNNIDIDFIRKLISL